MIIRKLILSTLVIVPFLFFSQNFKKEKRIYLLDITKSMWGLEGKQYDVFDKVKDELYKGISDIRDPETVVTIIPFQGTYTYEILDSWTFKAGDKNTLEQAKKTINSYNIKSVPGGFTDIFSALEKAKKQIDPRRINYIFMLTDGEQSAVPSSPNRINQVAYDHSALLKSLNGWCSFAANKDVHLFYTMLTEAAVDPKIIEIIRSQCNAYMTKGTDINIAFVQPAMSRLKVNLHDNPERLEIPFGANNWSYIKSNTGIKVSLKSNSIFELANSSVPLENNKIILKLKRKNGLSFDQMRKNSPQELKLQISLSAADVIVLKPEIDLIVSNKKERVLNLYFSKE